MCLVKFTIRDFLNELSNPQLGSIPPTPNRLSTQLDAIYPKSNAPDYRLLPNLLREELTGLL